MNLDCIETMTMMTENADKEILPYDTANMCLDMYKATPSVQSAFYAYLVSSLVDKNAEESGTDLENIWYIYVSH